MGVCTCGFCNVWLCVCVGFVMCVCVCVCEFCNVWLFLAICVLVFTVLYCFFYVYLFLSVTSVRTTATE